MTVPPPMSLAELRDFYHHHLLNHVMPFWLRHSIDHEHGGVLTFLADDGRVLSTDKVIWSQARALWVFSALINHLGPNPQYQSIANNIAQFIIRHGRDESGGWVFRLTRNGDVVEPASSVYADAFAIYGLTEYARASGSQEALRIALEGYYRTSPR